MIKKIDIHNTHQDLQDKINEIVEVLNSTNANVADHEQKIGHLSDKEETSNGERDACARCGCWRIAHPLPTACDKFIKPLNPPQQEEPKGDKPKYAGWYCQEPECGFVCYMASEKDIKEHMGTHNPQLKEESPKEDECGDLLSNCCAWDFDPLGFEKEEGIWQERCGRCGRLCEPIYLSKRDILNIQRCKTMEPK